mmetsp:Transcript_35217/g.6332  ORF Transcript_35217/g.6332 Transcript_35217/m.6332 type:complete len:179 (+) Transcript_35217:210-746(+)
MECIRFLASSNYQEKRVGYLGLTQLLTETNDIVMMVTNTLRVDLESDNSNVVGLALTALGNIGSFDICRDLAPYVVRLIEKSTHFIKKKAILACARIVRKYPDVIEEVVPLTLQLLKDKQHCIVLTTAALIDEILVSNPEFAPRFQPGIQDMLRILRTLLLSGYSFEFDVQGINDPIL